MNTQHASNFFIRKANWSGQDQIALKDIRTQVFIHEQQVPPSLEWDTDDQHALHLLAISQPSNKAIGCARILISSDLNSNQIQQLKLGRMAVLPRFRCQGIGSALLSKAIEYAKNKQCKLISLSAQTHAIDFYKKAGFSITSEPYLDADILHVDMQLMIEA